MVRTQIQLTEEQAARLRTLSAEQGVSVAALIRQGVDHVLSESSHGADWELALSVLGRHRDLEGATDVAVNHDDYLADAYEHWRR
jgi:predicted DNA-binding protein